MIARAFCLILLGVLEVASSAALAQESANSPPITEESERLAGFEVSDEAAMHFVENAGIFTPLSPITIESEPVKLPEDQEED